MVKKLTISERTQELLRKLFFSQRVRNGLILRIDFDLIEMTFFCQTGETGQLLPKKVFFPQNEPHGAKLRFSDVLNHFHWKFSKPFFYYQKSDYLRKN